jgi:hypothetical protein
MPQNYVDVPVLGREGANVTKRCLAFQPSRLPGSWSQPLAECRLDCAEMPAKGPSLSEILATMRRIDL